MRGLSTFSAVLVAGLSLGADLGLGLEVDQVGSNLRNTNTQLTNTTSAGASTYRDASRHPPSQSIPTPIQLTSVQHSNGSVARNLKLHVNGIQDLSCDPLPSKKAYESSKKIVSFSFDGNKAYVAERYGAHSYLMQHTRIGVEGCKKNQSYSSATYSACGCHFAETLDECAKSFEESHGGCSEHVSWKAEALLYHPIFKDDRPIEGWRGTREQSREVEWIASQSCMGMRKYTNSAFIYLHQPTC